MIERGENMSIESKTQLPVSRARGSRSTLYKVRKDGWLKPYEVTIEGKKYIDLHPRNHKPLDQYLKGILQWRPSNPIRSMTYMDV